MNEVKRLHRIVAVRTTQRDISVQHLTDARGRVRHASDQLTLAKQRMDEAQKKAVVGAKLSPADLERMDMAKAAAREEIAAWRERKEAALGEQEAARERVKAQHTLLRQSELMGERAEKEERGRQESAARKREDERAGRFGGKLL
jgi:hypothetical protein